MQQQRSQSYAKKTRHELEARHKQTNEVSGVMHGEGFRKGKLEYESKPMREVRKTEIQHQVLCNDPTKFTDFDKLYGKKQNLRHLDPGMDEILGWGEYDPPVKNDFTTNKGAFIEKYKINKMGVEFITEKQDNFRNPAHKKHMTKEEQICNYLKEENQTLIRSKVYNNLVDKDHMALHSSEYQDQTLKHDFKRSKTSRSLHSFYDNVTVAGKARYLKPGEKGQPIVTPQEFTKQQLEDKIREAWQNIMIDPQLVRGSGSQGGLENDDLNGNRNHASLLSGNTSSSPNKKVLSAEAQRILDEQMRSLNDDQRKELEEKLKNMKLCSRWLPDSSLTTYFGKPAFHSYGNANTNPSYGGLQYGQYMKTFNINPHSGGNKPEFSQIHGRTLLGGTVQVRAPGSRSPKKKPIKMTRKPIPPRVAPLKSQVPPEEIVKALKARLPVSAETWKEAQAKELEILPPTFTEKHLQTKKAKEEKSLVVGRVKEQKKQTFELETIKDKYIARDSPNQSDHNTMDSNRVGADSGQKSQTSLINRSGLAQDMSDRNMENKGENSQMQKNIPFCDVHGGLETTAMEFLHLLDPKNYKFLPPTFTTQIRAAGRLTAKSEGLSNLLNLEN